jgi:uncharacterized protein (TIGR02145 family)
MNTEKLLHQFEQALKRNNTALIAEISAILERNAPQPRFGKVSILGREHKTVIIGKQEWMTENLFCPELGFHHDNDPKNSEGGYGTLHTHYAMPAIQELLPDDWRVPTDEDWDVLIKYVGEDSGTKLKSKTGWDDGGNGTDDYGFRVLPSGFRNYNGSYFYDRGRYAYFWSSSAYDGTRAWYRQFSYNRADVSRSNTNRSNGFSVRCIRDIK